MNINELFESIQDEFIPEDINGEFLLHDNSIIWSFTLIDEIDDAEYFNEDEEESFDFEISSSEELLQDAYQEDLEMLQMFLDENEENHLYI